MKLGILKCDSVSEPLAATHGQYPQMFAALLSPADPAMEFVVYDVEQSEFPSDIDAVDAYLISGSRHGVNDGFAWIERLEEFVRNLHAARKKVIGICFGHQLIAKALGGEVIKSPKGWGVGMSQNQMLRQKEWMIPAQAKIHVLVSHQDQVVILPDGAEILASSAFCPYYMMQVGTHFLSLQGHPEFTKEYTRDLLLSREDKMDEHTFAHGLASLKLPEDDALIAQWVVNFLRS